MHAIRITNVIRQRYLVALSLGTVAACALSPAEVGVLADAGTAAVAAGSTAVVVSRPEPRTVDRSQIVPLTIRYSFQNCQEDCVDVSVHAMGGVPPYTYVWHDGATGPERHVCSDKTTWAVTVTDSPLDATTPPYEAQRTTATSPLREVDELLCVSLSIPAECGPRVPVSGPVPEPEPEPFCLTNPSFEEAPALGRVPDSWLTCRPTPELYARTPDASWTPTEGANYLSLLVSQTLGEQSVSTRMCSGGMGWRAFQVDLARSSMHEGAGILQLWVGSQPCDKHTLLWTSDPITDATAWQTSCGAINSGDAYATLVVVPVDATQDSEIVIDNFRAVDACE